MKVKIMCGNLLSKNNGKSVIDPWHILKSIIRTLTFLLVERHEILEEIKHITVVEFSLKVSKLVDCCVKFWLG